MFLKEEKICYKMVYYTFVFNLANRQKLCWKVRIYIRYAYEKKKNRKSFLKAGLALKNRYC